MWEELLPLPINTPKARLLPMGYQQRGASPRNSGRGRGIPRHEKAKAKQLKHHPHGLLSLRESQASTQEEIANRTLNALSHLGNQRFVLSPFSGQLNFWLTSLKNVLFEFESNPGIAVDEQFAKERSQIISNIELELTKRGEEELHSGETAKNLLLNKAVLEQIEQDYGAAMKAVGKRKEAETKALSANIEDIRVEFERIAQMKTGILRGVSKTAKAQRETEATRRLEVAEGILAEAVDRFNAEQEKVRIEYGTRKKAVSRQIQEEEKEILSQEIDDSLDARHTACEALVNTVNSFLQRNRLSQH